MVSYVKKFHLATQPCPISIATQPRSLSPILHNRVPYNCWKTNTLVGRCGCSRWNLVSSSLIRDFANTTSKWMLGLANPARGQGACCFARLRSLSLSCEMQSRKSLANSLNIVRQQTFFVVGSRKHLKFFERCIFEDLFSLHDGPRRTCNKKDILKVT